MISLMLNPLWEHYDGRTLSHYHHLHGKGSGQNSVMATNASSWEVGRGGKRKGGIEGIVPGGGGRGRVSSSSSSSSVMGW